MPSRYTAEDLRGMEAICEEADPSLPSLDDALSEPWLGALAEDVAEMSIRDTGVDVFTEELVAAMAADMSIQESTIDATPTEPNLSVNLDIAESRYNEGDYDYANVTGERLGLEETICYRSPTVSPPQDLFDPIQCKAYIAWLESAIDSENPGSHHSSPDLASAFRDLDLSPVDIGAASYPTVLYDLFHMDSGLSRDQGHGIEAEIEEILDVPSPASTQTTPLRTPDLDTINVEYELRHYGANVNGLDGYLGWFDSGVDEDGDVYDSEEILFPEELEEKENRFLAVHSFPTWSDCESVLTAYPLSPLREIEEFPRLEDKYCVCIETTDEDMSDVGWEGSSYASDEEMSDVGKEAGNTKL